ncbi:MFS transporter [Paenibacillus cremeus]|uniref:MFS transporter n=1 Tax=Paenibacillus cremeus TaxID=2163881 RepID=A0A559K9T9_9BACL|nr:MFS transporter [Paenibacillus cremeus]TVY08882.1 MFS transporter [Paenibacillus cremeus]
MSGLAAAGGGDRRTVGISLLSIMASSLAYMLGVNMVRPIVALYFDSVGYAAFMIGFFVALNAIIPILFGMPIGSRIDRMGTRRAVWVGATLCLISSVSSIVGIHLENVILVVIGQMLNGFGGMFSWGALQAAASIAANRSDEKKSNHIISNFSFINTLGQLVGPSLGGFFSDVGGYSFVFYVFAAFNVLGLILAVFLPMGSYASRERQSEQASNDTKKELSSNATGKSPVSSAAADKASFWKSYLDGFQLIRKNKPFAVAILLNGILFMLIDVRTTFFPLFLSGTGLTHTQIGNMLSVSALAAFIVRPVTGYLMSWLGHRRIMLISIFSGAICLLLLMVKPQFWLLAGIVFIWGACTSVNQPVALMMVSHTVEAGERGMAMSLRTMSNRFVQLTNPVVFGTLITAIGLSYGFAILGLLLLGFGTVYLRQSRPQSTGALNNKLTS